MTYIDTLPAAEVASSIDEMRATEDGQSYIDRAANGDSHFALFMLLVDRKMMKVIGLGHRDIEDALWFEMYEDGMSPEDAIIEAFQGHGIYECFIPVIQQIP